jgi:hypothetical protein
MTLRTEDLATLRTFLVEHFSTLVEPYPGLTYKSPITFRWQGALNEGELFQVTTRHVASKKEIQTSPMAEQEWTYDLPAGKVGEWWWKVWVVKEGQVLVTSEERNFWFDPWEGRDMTGSGVTTTLPFTPPKLIVPPPSYVPPTITPTSEP